MVLPRKLSYRTDFGAVEALGATAPKIHSDDGRRGFRQACHPDRPWPRHGEMRVKMALLIVKKGKYPQLERNG
ncbi:hypothetical protein HHL26_16665 [Sphingobium sp. TB-6]|uniref:hypothetical protein n=1 Tax=Sphingobium sp. TB-6 TaxID=2728850 RepID=UPI00111E13F8|nr:MULTISPECIES: hypothetical protein [Sphingomonadaceae]NML90683.1 hypothetical protein [Sphingobium sp. TB-6]